LAELATQTGFPLDRVKTYFVLFGASDDVMRFLEEHEVAPKVAAEIVRYQRATNEARARRLIERYKETPADRPRDRRAAEARDSATERRATAGTPGASAALYKLYYRAMDGTLQEAEWYNGPGCLPHPPVGFDASQCQDAGVFVWKSR
jgi:hypothetical protein